jgi:nodulation protein E
VHRVAITGVGVVSALGVGADAFESALFAGRSGIRPITKVTSESLRFQNGAEVSDFDPSSHFQGKQLSILDPFSQYALVAAREAVKQSGIRFVPHRTAVVTGAGGGGQPTVDQGYYDLYDRKSPRVSPFNVPRIMANAAASHICMEFGVTGPSFTLSTACSSSNHAIGHAFWLIRSGICGAAIAGGSEAVFTLGYLKSWEAMRVISSDTCRPFSKDRQGMILGEGGAMLVLEDYDSARERGATILADIVGFGMSSDAFHITQPSVDGAAAAIQAALTDAGLSSEHIQYVNAHGTGTQMNDPTETAAIRKVFGPHAGHMLVSSTKSMHGHTLGAAGAIEAVATILAIRRQCAPPTANYTQPDPQCDLDYVPNAPRNAAIEFAISNSFAFGGVNAVLALAAPGS